MYLGVGFVIYLSQVATVYKQILNLREVIAHPFVSVP